ncbi:cyclic nucleotide-binding domain-containing protein 1 isoform X2 [Engraulis encrasicolus]
MKSYKDIFIRPPKPLPGIPWIEDNNKRGEKQGEASEEKASGRKPKMTASGGGNRVFHGPLISQMLKVAKKYPVERSPAEHQLMLSALKLFPVLMEQIDPPELRYISRMVMIESWDRGHMIFGTSGFYIVVRGSVRPCRNTQSAEPVNLPVIGAGGSFGTLEACEESDSDANCVLTQEPCEILKIPHGSYAKVRKELQGQDFALKQNLVQQCSFYHDWPRLSVQKVANLLQMKTFPAHHVLVKEGRVCPFIAFIHKGECNILQDIGTVMKLAKRGRINCVVVGQLGPLESFGEVSILTDQPSPCTVVTQTPVQAGIIAPDKLKELDSVTRSLMRQSAKPTCGKLTEEEISKQYVRQERQKEWEHVKKTVLSDSLYYNGILPGIGKWTENRSKKTH